MTPLAALWPVKSHCVASLGESFLMPIIEPSRGLERLLLRCFRTLARDEDRAAGPYGSVRRSSTGHLPLWDASMSTFLALTFSLGDPPVTDACRSSDACPGRHANSSRERVRKGGSKRSQSPSKALCRRTEAPTGAPKGN